MSTLEIFQEELQDLELINRRFSRTRHLIAIFCDGYAAGWVFAVKEAFREALDIRLTTQTINKKVHPIWTQGQNFAFQDGDTFFNHRSAYEDWETFLKGKNPICIQVKTAKPAKYVNKEIIEIATTPVVFTRLVKEQSKEE